VQRRKKAALQKLVKRLARDDFNDASENVEADSIFPDFAG